MIIIHGISTTALQQLQATEKKLEVTLIVSTEFDSQSSTYVITLMPEIMLVSTAPNELTKLCEVNLYYILLHVITLTSKDYSMITIV
jgi:hypothetical protein